MVNAGMKIKESDALIEPSECLSASLWNLR